LRSRRRRVSACHPALRPLHSLNDSLAIERLQNVIDGVHVEGADCVLIVGRGKHDLRQRLRLACDKTGRPCLVAFEQLLNYGKSVEAWHLHVEKHQVGMMLLDQLDGLNAVSALSDDVYVADRVEQVFELVASQLFVIDNERRD